MASSPSSSAANRQGPAIHCALWASVTGLHRKSTGFKATHSSIFALKTRMYAPETADQYTSGLCPDLCISLLINGVLSVDTRADMGLRQMPPVGPRLFFQALVFEVLGRVGRQSLI